MKTLLFILSLGFLVPSVALAHVKWFVDSPAVTEQAHGVYSFYSITDIPVLVWFVILILAVLVFRILDKKIQAPAYLVKFGADHKQAINRTAQIILGLFLISVSFLWKIIIIPEIHVESTLTTILMYLQVAIGVLYVFNIKPQITSLGLIVLALAATVSESIVAVFENSILIVLACYFYIINAKEGSATFAWKEYGVDIVRVGTGISLIVLAFTEKMLYPELSLEFLAIHHWNFMHPIFPWFTDNLFVLSTGFAEIIFGIWFIFGYMTRVTTVLIAVFFACSVVTMMVQFGAWEVEDLVVYSAAILFLAYGNGKTKLFAK